MPITNIVDGRRNEFCSIGLQAIIEPSCHDNDQPGAQQFDFDDPKITTGYDEINNVTIAEALEWANTFQFPVTLYLYDGEDTSEITERHEEFIKILNDTLNIDDKK
jgi:hypothetical protein